MWQNADKDILFIQMRISSHLLWQKTDASSVKYQKSYNPSTQIPGCHFGKTRSFEGRGEV